MTEEAGNAPVAPWDEAALASRAEALGIALPADRCAAVLEGARALDAAARLLRDALDRMVGEPR